MRTFVDGERLLQSRNLRCLLFIGAIYSCCGQSVSADDYTTLTAPPPPAAKAEAPRPSTAASQPGAQAPPSPAFFPIPTAGAKPADQLQVEAALGARDLSRDYLRFSAMFPAWVSPRPTFADFLYREYETRRRSGIALAGIVAPIIAGMTVLGSMLLYNHGKEDGGGFCNNTWDDDPYNDCEGDNGELSGIIIISSLGSIATIATFTPGIVKAAKYNKRMRRIAPLVPGAGLSVSLGVVGWVLGGRF